MRRQMNLATMKSSRSLSPRHEGGAALLLLLMVVILALSSVVLVNLNTDEIQTRQLTDTRQTLALAKRALLQYAALQPDLLPGQPHALPCPDIDDSGGFTDGEAHTIACGAVAANSIGRLPWRTLGLTALRDPSKSCLWYAVSGGHKAAGPETVGMINADSNGQLALYSVETGDWVEGSTPDQRPVALIFAGMRPLANQTRSSVNATTQCVPAASAGQYLDLDAASGISNAVIDGISDGIDLFARTAEFNEQHNDQVISISRAEFADAVQSRVDFESGLRGLGLQLASCVANYGSNNPAGINDKRLPWPALMGLTDYRIDGAYDDTSSGIAAGRLADVVDDSNALTGNSIARVLSDCDNAAVPGWTPTMLAKWRNWKDHFFYAVAGSFAPNATTPSACASCVSVNGSGNYAAVLVFANARLSNLNQLRDAPPIDADLKRIASNYLEGLNAVNIPGSSATPNFQSQTATANFNDFLFCIDSAMNVSEC